MAQQIINTGAAANDGTGDPLRTAFTETNDNFTEIYAAGPVDSNVRITDNTILTLNTNGNLVLAPNGTGRVVANVDVVPNRANVRNLGSSTQRWSTVYTQYLNVTNGTTVDGDLTVGGNLTVTGNTVQIGNLVTDAKTLQLANTANTANAATGSGITVGASDNIATLLYNSTGNVWTMNIGLSAVGNVTAPYFIGNGSQLTGLPVPYGNSNVVALLAGFGSNTIVTTGNISGGYFIGNGSTLTSTAGANVSGTVANATYATSSGSAATAGTVTTAAQGNITSVGVLTSLSATGNVTGGNLLTSAQVVASGVIQTGTGFSTGGYLSVNGSSDLHDTNIIGNLSVNVIRSDDSTVVLIQDGVEIDGDAVVNGNVTADYFIGNGSQLTGISTANTGNVTFDDVNIIGTGNLNLQPNGSASEYLNIYLTGAADIHVAAGGAGGNVILGTDEEANVAVLQGGNVAIQAGNVAGTKTWTFDTAGNLTLPMDSVVYETNIPDGALSGSAIALKPTGGTTANQQLLIYPTANDGDHIHLTSGNLYTTELFLGSDNLYVKLANTGNVVINSNDGNSSNAMWTFGTDGNLTAPGNISATGNVTGVYIKGNGSELTNLPAPTVAQDITSTGDMSMMTYDGNLKYVNYATVEPATGTIKSSGNISATGNVVGGNIRTVGLISSTGNVTGGNILTAGIVSATGNVSGNFFIGNGSQLTGIAASYGNANVATFLAAFGSNAISTTGNVTASNFVGNISITGNVVGTQPNVTLVAGSYSTVFDNTGNLTLPGNTFAVNYANNTPVNPVTRFESSWTVPVGNSTQSFTVAASETYYLWVDCNIPNGILVWNATATVTNTNVPVVGYQYAWVYDGGGTPIDFTSIPNQFIGTANAIVRSNVAPSSTTNRFDFGINNTSGGNVTVRYGWAAIS